VALAPLVLGPAERTRSRFRGLAAGRPGLEQGAMVAPPPRDLTLASVRTTVRVPITVIRRAQRDNMSESVATR
jgi:hypothetical protein